MELNTGVGGVQILHQKGQIFARMFSGAQEHGHHGDLRCAPGGELLGGLWQRWCAQFQVSAKDRPTRLLRGDTRRNGLKRKAPQWITGAVCK